MTTRRTFYVAFFAGLLASSLFRWMAPPELVKVYASPQPVAPREMTVKRVLYLDATDSVPLRPAAHEVGIFNENAQLREEVAKYRELVDDLDSKLGNREKTIKALLASYRAHSRLIPAIYRYRLMVTELQRQEAEPWLTQTTRFKFNDWPLDGGELSNPSTNDAAASTTSEENGLKSFFTQKFEWGTSN